MILAHRRECFVGALGRAQARTQEPDNLRTVESDALAHRSLKVPGLRERAQ
jgi:hypothetical protein